MREHSVAVLIHGFSWRASSFRFSIADGIELVSVQDTIVGAAYHDLCEQQGVDDTDPLQYELALVFEPTFNGEPLLGARNPFEQTSRLSNVVVLVGECASTSIRVLYSQDDFRSACSTDLVFGGSHATECIQELFPKVADNEILAIKRLNTMSERAWRTKYAAGRLTTALTCFGYAWRGMDIYQIALYLGMALRTLFSTRPHNNSPAHLAQLVTRFLQIDREETDGARTTLTYLLDLGATLHNGDSSDDDFVRHVISQAFPLVCRVFRMVLSADDCVAIFENNHARAELLADLRAS